MKMAFLGYGKMGKAIEREALAAGHESVLRVHAKHPLEKEELLASGAEMVFEFSRPETAFDHLRVCLEMGLPVVCGTTGWLDKKPEIEALCREKSGAFFYASNFSIGVHLFFALNRYLAGLMDKWGCYEVSIEETHHIHKLDAPSGTAIQLAEDLLDRLSAKKRWTKGLSMKPEELSVVSHREGEVPGTHLIRYQSEEDEILLQHKAFSRLGFARGALRVAEWLKGRQGCFGMADFLG